MNSIEGDIARILSEIRMNTALAQARPADESIPDFSAMLKQSIDKVNSLQKTSDALATAYESGDPQVNLAETMIAMQKAGIAFQSMVQVRNKLLSAYQEIMSMPI
ncbi:MAG: flagellar hook-basal body complex protein FliE [Gammaproteobacteria bacterium RBG_16_57_12]|nr:MAG: flagellar hook-basal body complex protein FliE [Gammaproteobacteria bacterium RBG_16_57_12]